MLHLKKVLGAKPKEHVVSELEDMLTPWGEHLDPHHVLEEHPTPQFARTSYTSLNGPWKCAFVAGEHDPDADLAFVTQQASAPDAEAFDSEIIVPFSPESLLSGVKRQLQPTELLWYRRTFASPERTPDDRVILHFQAVDYACSVFVNDRIVGSHEGGYTSFSFDVTDFLLEGKRAQGENEAESGGNELLVCVADPSEFGGHVRGKQRFDRGDIWYTAQSGIWQSVWLEVMPQAHIESALIEPDLETGILTVGVRVSASAVEADTHGPDGAITVVVLDADGTPLVCETADIADGTGAVALHVPDVRAWSPSTPHLYGLKLTYGADEVNSYCGFRTVEMRPDEHDCPRLFLNGEPLFIKGVLDQAYWSDGLMTSPSDEALVFDIEAMRDAGFNLMRKHIKVESDRWYYHCDRLGMLVLQDMVSGGDEEIKTWHWSYKPTLFKFSWSHYRDDKPNHWEALGAGDARYRDEWTRTCRETIEQLCNHPSIIGWSLFNEGWGQFCATDAFELVRSLNSTRLIDAVSGWFDQGCGDFNSVHNYFRDMKVWRDRKGKGNRAFFLSEFGGFTHRVEGHSSLDEAYGYEPYDDVDEWNTAIDRLLAEVESLEPKGLVGYVYTQVSDIEEETNGILTYDRRVNKRGKCEETVTDTADA